MKNITKIDQANDYLQKVFLPDYWNKRLMVEPENLDSEYRPLSSQLNLDEIFVIKEYRKVRKDHTFSYNGRTYLIDSLLDFSIACREVEVRTQEKGVFQVYFAGKKLCVSEVIEPRRASLAETQVENSLKAMRLADKLGNVSEAARQAGVSCQSIYRNRKILNEQGLGVLKKALKKESCYKGHRPKNVQEQVVKFSLENPHLGEAEVSRQVRQELGIEISRGSVRSLWLSRGLQTIALRIQALLQSSGSLKTDSMVQFASEASKKAS